jgi:hypothetical protein
MTASDASDLLQAIKTHLADVLALPVPQGYGLARQKAERKRAEDGVVALDFIRWYGRRPDNATYQRLVRLLHRLAADGRVALLPGPKGRTVAVRVLDRTRRALRRYVGRRAIA